MKLPRRISTNGCRHSRVVGHVSISRGQAYPSRPVRILVGFPGYRRPREELSMLGCRGRADCAKDAFHKPSSGQDEAVRARTELRNIGEEWLGLLSVG
jgi:hypothetical protein